MSRLRVLLVDDDEAFRESIAELLMDENVLVDEAEDGREALDMLSNPGYTPDILILDIAMPKIHGLEVVERLRKTRPDLPIIMLTSKGHLEDDLTTTTNKAVRKFLHKPVEFDDLLDALIEIGETIGKTDFGG